MNAIKKAGLLSLSGVLVITQLYPLLWLLTYSLITMPFVILLSSMDAYGITRFSLMMMFKKALI